MSRPTLYLSNWSSHRTTGRHGPGRKWTMMAKPRRWEMGEGRCTALSPLSYGVYEPFVAAMKSRSPADVAAYRRAFEEYLGDLGAYLTPGRLRAFGWASMNPADACVLADGDTLCCACSVAHARAGECHRAWAAPFLHRAGWSVVLDGRPFASAGPA